MTNEERKQSTYVGSAEIRMENTARRDALINAAEKAGFKAHCTEAISISLSGRAGQEHWYIAIYAPGKLDREEEREARVKLAAAWKGL